MFCILRTIIRVSFLSHLVLGYQPKVSVINDETTSSKWVAAAKSFEKLVWPQKDVFINILEQLLLSESSQKLSPECTKSLKYLKSGLKQRELWSYEFIESFSKGDIGYSRKNSADLGNLNTCINVQASDAGSSFNGKYCIVNVHLPVPQEKPQITNPMTAIHLNVSNVGLSGTVYEFYAHHIEYFNWDSFALGICAPTTCSRGDIETILSYASNGTELIVSLKENCDSHDSRKYGQVPLVSKISTLAIFALITFVILSTVVDQLQEKFIIRNRWTILQHFNVLKSHKKLMKAPSKNEEYDRLRPMDVFICIFQFSSPLAHSVYAKIFVPFWFPPFTEYANYMEISEVGKFLSMYLSQGAQNILFIGGFYNCYIVYPMFLKAYHGKSLQGTSDKVPETNKNKKKGNKGIPFLMFLLQKYLRIIPTLGFMILVTFSAGSFVTDPAMNELMGKFQNSCRNGWWKTLFMINNFSNPMGDICLNLSWYISLDFQLWILSYLPLLWMVKSKNIGVIITCLYIFIGIISTSIVTYLYDLPSILTGREFELLHFYIYDRNFIIWFAYLHNGLFPYFSGFLLAYFLRNTKKFDQKVLIHWLKVSCVTFVTGFVILVIPCIWIIYEWPSLRWFEVLYSVIFRIPFSSTLATYCILAYFDLYKHIPFLDLFFNAKIWNIAKKLTFPVFVSHFFTTLFTFYFFYGYQKPESNAGHVAFLIMVQVTVYTLAYLIHIFIESPFASLLSSYRNRNVNKNE